MAVQADVSQQTEVEQMIAQVRAAFGPVELLVNNAGIAYTQEHGEFGFAEWERMFAVNVHGPFLTTWAVKGRDDRGGALGGSSISPRWPLGCSSRT